MWGSTWTGCGGGPSSPGAAKALRFCNFCFQFCFLTPGSIYAGEAHRGGPWGAEGQEPGGGGLVRSPRALGKEPKKKKEYDRRDVKALPP